MTIKFALFAAALAASTAASALTVYTDEAAFNSAISGATNYTFSFAGTEFLGTSYTLGPVTFASNQLQSYKDAYGVPTGVVPYLANYGSLLTISSTSTFLGLHLGSYFGAQTVGYAAGLETGTLSVPAPNETTFIGFIDTSPISVTFTNDSELDTISVTSGAVPEPASWVLMIAGFGLVGFAARRRSATVTA